MIYKLIAIKMGIEDVARYSIIRRAQMPVVTFLLLGMDIALLRYLPIAGNIHQKLYYFNSAFLIFFVLTLTMWIGVLIFIDDIYVFMFGTREPTLTGIASFTFFTSFGLYLIIYSWLRGSMRTLHFNLLNLLVNFLLPVGLLLATRRIVEFFLLWSLGITVISVWFLIVSGGRFCLIPLRILKKILAELAGYGTGRVLSGLLFFTALYLGSIVGVKYGGLKKGGMIALAVSLVQVSYVLVMPLFSVVTPRVSHHIKEGKLKNIALEIMNMIALIFSISVVITIVFIFFVDEVLIILFGKEILREELVFRIMAGCIPFGVSFMGIGAVLEAIVFKPLVGISVLSSFFFSVAGFIIFFFWLNIKDIYMAVGASYIIFHLFSFIMAGYFLYKRLEIPSFLFIKKIVSGGLVAFWCVLPAVVIDALPVFAILKILTGVPACLLIYIISVLLLKPVWFSSFLLKITERPT